MSKIINQVTAWAKEDYDDFEVDNYAKSHLLWDIEDHLFSCFSKNQQILDVGCGTGRVSFGLEKKGFKKIVGLDKSIKMVTRAKMECNRNKSLCTFVLGNVTDIPFPDNFFDVVYFSYNGYSLLPSNKDRKLAFVEMSRVLSLHGILILCLPSMQLINKNGFLKIRNNAILGKNNFVVFDKSKNILSFMHYYTNTEIENLCLSHYMHLKEIREVHKEQNVYNFFVIEKIE